MNRSAIPAPVTQVTEAAGTWLPERLATVEERLAELTTGHGPALADDAGSTLAAGGKRLRPLLVLLCAGPDAGRDAIRAATAVELVHMATLVHDDVLDGALLRRGRPTVAARSGRERAVATGDLLFSRAFAELGEGDDSVSAEARERQVELLSAASVSLALGELAQRRDAFDTTLSAERYFERCTLKTAKLFECACLIGRSESDPLLAEFGREMGLAFQLLDDVLDVSGTPERTGKARGTDLLDGTVTLPLIMAREADGSIAAVDLAGLDAGEAEELCDRIAATGALDQVRLMASEEVASAKRKLETADLSDEERRLLGLVADGVVERYS